MIFYQDTLQSYDQYEFYKVCQKIFNFCNIDLSSFYLDILKDRLYTFSPNCPQRRSGQFVLYQILEMLIKIIAPILSFTAEEAYSFWHNHSDKKDSLFLTTADCNLNLNWIDQPLIEQWEKIIALRQDVLKEIEKKREKSEIGSSLEAEVYLSLNDNDYSFYAGRIDILREVFIVSKVFLNKGQFSIRVQRSQGQKCARCWNWFDQLTSDEQFPGVCQRCLNALKGGR
jgi:isoleucyl-tRNA synthetase